MISIEIRSPAKEIAAGNRRKVRSVKNWLGKTERGKNETE
jgi:hypothetical protein